MSENIKIASERLKSIAEKETDIYAIVAVGSSRCKKYDEYSDLDVLFFTSDAGKYLHNRVDSWLPEFGRILSVVVDENVIGGAALCRILYENGFNLDLTLLDVREVRKWDNYYFFKNIGLAGFIPGYHSRVSVLSAIHTFLVTGYEIIIDKIGIGSLIDKVKTDLGDRRLDSIMSRSRLERNYHLFWQTCYKALLHLDKGDLDYLLHTLDKVIKMSLIRLVQWYTLLQPGKQDTNVYYKGAKLERWCDPLIIDRLYDTFSSPDPKALKDALHHTMNLYKELFGEIINSRTIDIDRSIEEQVLKMLFSDLSETERYDPKKELEAIKRFAKGNRDIQSIIAFEDPEDLRYTAPGRKLNFFLFTKTIGKYFRKETWLSGFPGLISFYVDFGSRKRFATILLANGMLIEVQLVNVRDLKQAKQYFWLKKFNLDRFLPSNVQAAIRKGFGFFSNTLSNGYSIVFSRIKIERTISRILESSGRADVLESYDRARFDRNYNRFWQFCYKTMILLVRRDLYYAKVWWENMLKDLLIELIEWESRDKKPGQLVYPDARRMDSWCERPLLEKLRSAQPYGDLEQMKQALMKTMALYKQVAHNLGNRHGFGLNPALEYMVGRFAVDHMLNTNSVSEENGETAENDLIKRIEKTVPQT